MAAQVLVRLGADLVAVRQQVISLLGGVSASASAGMSSEDRPIGATGRRLHLRVVPGRITLSVDDPALDELPELSVVVRTDPDLATGSQAIVAAVREVVRQLDSRLAELETSVAFEAEEPLDPGDSEPGGGGDAASSPR